MKLRHRILSLFLVCAVAGCGAGSPAVTSTGTSPSGDNCSGTCASASTFLSSSDVQQVIAQAVAEAKARGVNATIAVVDRVGNVLAVYRMGDKASRIVLIATSVDASGNATLSSGLEGIKLPIPQDPALSQFNIDDQAAIAKAITGAYLSSEGNAFSSRTASQIVQEHFNVGEANQASGPLFGVQFSQLACSDFIRQNNVAAPTPGPHNSPLGLSADPGGFPLYKGGTVVGGVGVMADGLYSLDKDIAAPDSNVDDEAIALAASYSFAAPVDRRADRITAGGVTLRFSDVDFSQLRSDPASAPAFSSLSASTGGLAAVAGYSDGMVHTGTAWDQPASGIRADTSDFAAQNGYIFVDGANNPLHPPMAGTDGATALTQAEVRQILQSALGIANRARAQIRRPDGSPAQVTISVVDTNGVILGMVRTPDAPMFGADVSLQKARSATFMSSASAAAYLQALPDAKYIKFPAALPLTLTAVPLGGYASAAQTFFGQPTLLTDGGVAFTARAIGNLARPFYPDDIDGEPNGPFSKPAGQWSVFSTGLQLDLSINAILQHVLSVASGGGIPDVGQDCTGVDFPPTAGFSHPAPLDARLANGLQIFPGGSPIYRNGVLVGGVGVSGDGVDQDDMIGFLGLAQASQALNGSVTEAPAAIRSDQFSPQGTRLRYVQCPQAPFIDSNQENVCASY
jgi:uncharacterized protein GlcG (DUF336 family)